MKKITISLFVILISVAAQAQKKLVVVGSSTAYGTGASTYDSAWVGRLQLYYRQNNADGLDTVVTNLALGGFTTYQVMPTGFTPPSGRPAPDPTRNVTKALSYSPDIVIFNLPSNDIASAFTKTEVMSNLRTLYNTVVATGARAFVSTTQPRDLSNVTARQYQRDLVDSINIAFGSKALDFWSDLATTDGSNMIRAAVAAGDGTHVNDLGHRLLFGKVVAANIFGGSIVVNQPPTAYAGADQTITLPTNSVTLNGAGFDPEGAIASYSWTKVSGPVGETITASSSATTNVTGLQQGTYIFRLTVTDNKGATGSDDISVFVNAGTTTTPPASSTFRIEAENYTNMYGVLKESCWDAGLGQDLHWIENGDWMEYAINPATAGTYTVNLRIAAPAAGGQFQIRKSDGTVLATVTVPSTGDWQMWQTVTTTVILAAGQQTLRIVSTAAPLWNFNWMEFVLTTTPPPPPPPPVPAISTRIEAENYTNMYGVLKESCWDAGLGQDLHWIENGDWMEYSVNVATAGNYTVNFRIAAPAAGGQFQVRKADGTALATVNVPSTGDWQMWQTVTANVALVAGVQTIRIVSTASPMWNFNWMDILGSSSVPVVPATSFKVEAETYTNMFGIYKESCWDAGLGEDLHWIENGDWMDYSINPSAAGTYTVNLRIAAPAAGGQLQLRKADGTILATVTVPSTGDWQMWQTISTTVSLAAGQQTLRVVSTAAPMWNFNWMEFVPATTATTSAKTSEVGETEVVATTTGMQVFPNPIQDRFMLKVTSAYTGKMTLQVVDMNGAVVKSFNLSKSNTGTVQTYLSIGDLKKGTYVLKLTQKDGSQSINISKQ